MSKSLNELRDDAYANSKAHGFYDTPATFGDRIALIHSEASEALEEFRNGKKPNETYYSKPFHECDYLGPDGKCLSCEQLAKPEGIPAEVADIIIRCLDLCGLYGIDIEKMVEEKMAYNATRPYRHGGKKL